MEPERPVHAGVRSGPGRAVHLCGRQRDAADRHRRHHVPAAAQPLRRHPDHAVRQQPDRHDHGRGELRGDGHSRRGHPRVHGAARAGSEPVGPECRTEHRRRARPRHLAAGQHVRRRVRRRPEPGPERPQRLRLHPGCDRRGRRLHRADRQRHPGAADHHPDRRLHGVVHRGQPEERAGAEFGAAGPEPAGIGQTDRVRRDAGRLPRLVARLLGPQLRPVRRQRRQRLLGERLLPGHLHDRRGGSGNYPVHFINGVFRATQDNSKWSNGYWYWNQRDVYHSFYSFQSSQIW